MGAFRAKSEEKRMFSQANRVQQHISMQIKVYISVSQSLAILCLWENHVYFYKLMNGKYSITPDKTTYDIADPSSMQDATWT